MADNSTLPATGDVILADEVAHPTFGTGKVQLVKLVDGAVNGTAGASVAATGALSVVPRRDTGRTRVVISFQAAAPGTADTLLNLVKVSNGVAAAAATSIGVAAGKTLRINAINIGVRATVATAAFATMVLRGNPTGATLIGSAAELRLDAGTTAAVIGSSVGNSFAMPDGLEWSGTQTLGVSALAQATTNQLSVALVGYEY